MILKSEMRVSFMKKIVFILFLAVYYTGISCSPVFYSYVTEGKEVYYSLDDDHVKRILDVGVDHVEERG